jgi:hypothetical protein
MILLLKIGIVVVGLIVTFLLMVGVSYDYNDFRAADRNKDYKLPNYSYIKGLIRTIARIFRIKVKEY